jgi:hypothetical protein
MPMAEPCPWVRWVRFTFGSRAFPISPITAWTTSAVLVEIADIAECHEAVVPDIVARATW